MSLEDDNKAFVRRYFDHLNKDPLGTDEYFATGYRYHNSSMPHVNDLSTLKEFNTAAFNALAEVRFTLEDIVAEGDKVVYRASATGTHKGEFMGIAGTGKRVTLRTIVISRMANGKFQEDWESLDGMYLLQQLGAWPPT